MFSYIKGMIKGRRLAIESTILCKDIVNFLITSGIQIVLPDTVYILQESYAICSFYIRKSDANKNTVGAMVIFSQNILKDWLIKTFSECNKEYDFSKGVDSVIQGLPDFFVAWLKELASTHNDLKGRSFYKWCPAANAQFLEHVSLHIYNKFGRTPEKFEIGFLTSLLNRMIRRSLSFWDRLSLGASLEEDLPDGLKKKLKNIVNE